MNQDFNSLMTLKKTSLKMAKTGMQTVTIYRENVDEIVWHDLALRFPKQVNKKKHCIILNVFY